MKRILIPLMMAVFLFQTVSAINVYSPSNIYLDKNVTYPLVLIPLDENVYNVTLNVYDGNWTTLNFTWTGEQYQLSILFNEIGDFPFVINSTDVTGNITGVFLVREAYDVTFRFYKAKQSFPFFSNKYINQMAYVTAELTGERTLFENNYDSMLEPFIAQLPLKNNQNAKPVWHSSYSNGVATLKLYEKDTEYAIRLIDGQISFAGEYAVPNVTKSYGINSYIGKYTFDGTDQTYDIYLSSKDLHPYRWLFNWILIIGMVVVVFVSIALFFMIPEIPTLSIIFGVGFTVILIAFRIVMFVIIG